MGNLSVIIVSWNTRHLLRECLESLYKFTSGISFEVFVVDNNSSDGSAEMVRKDFPQVILIENKENAGFSKANNQAIRVSKGRYVALLNPDTLLIEDVFSPLIKYADHYNNIGAIGPKILNGDGQKIQYSCARRLPNIYLEFCHLSGLSRKFPKTKVFGGTYMAYWDHNSSRYVEGLSGACMVVRRKAIDEVGLMDKNQFMYGDEIEWCKRILDAEWKIYYYSQASIIHYGEESSKQIKHDIVNIVKESKWYYYKKHYGEIYALIYCFQLFFFSMSKYICSVLFRRKDPNVKELTKIYSSTLKWSFHKISVNLFHLDLMDTSKN